MIYDDFLALLEGVKRSGDQELARCPGHEDRSASLTVREAEDGKILVYCHAGCRVEDIVAALGLTMADLGGRPQWGEPEAVYPYEDETQNVLYEVLRYPDKRFRQRHYDPTHPDAKASGWVWNLEGVRRVPYRLPELIEAVAKGEGVFVVEGEKDVERLRQMGLAATCNPMGAGKWRPEFTQHFHGARVCIVQDRDEAGRRHARTVQESLGEVAAEVIVRQSASGNDLSDHLDAGYKLNELVKPRPAAARGIVTAQQMADTAVEYLDYTPGDLPGWEMHPGVHGTQIRSGRMYALGGYTNDGKTAFALQGTRNLCEQGVRVGYFTLEMTNIDICNRLIQHKGVPLWGLEHPWEMKRLHPEFIPTYMAAVEEIRSWNLDIIFDTNLKPQRVAEEVESREYEMVVIDHIHRFGWKDRRHLEESIAALTNLSLDANIPILILCQLRRYQRGWDTPAFPPPGLQDFRETEMLGAESAAAYSIWREREDDGRTFRGNLSRFQMLKNRHPTRPSDRSGYEEFLNFDLTTSLYSRSAFNGNG